MKYFKLGRIRFQNNGYNNVVSMNVVANRNEIVMFFFQTIS